MAVFTTRLSLKKPAGGSSGTIPGDDQADIDDINDNSDIIDDAIGFAPVLSTNKPATPFNGQPIMLTDAANAVQIRSGSEWIDPGIIPRGTTSQRDALWPTPANAAARVALANKNPLWLNTEKGYVQQYFAQFDDAGVVATTPVKKVFGWRAVGAERIPITQFTVGGGTPANVKKYSNTVELSGTSASITLDGVFTTDFDYYEIEIYVPTTTGTGNMTLQWRAAGAATGATSHFAQRAAATGASVTSAAQTAAASSIIASVDVAANGFLGKIRVQDPMTNAEFTHALFEGANPGGNWMSGSLQLRAGTQVDGFAFAGLTMNSHSLIRVWGMANGV